MKKKKKDKDSYYRLAKKEGYRSRASYKLLQIQERFRIIKKGDTIIDLGAAPGGWLQVAKQISGGKIIGVDLVRIKPIKDVIFIMGDFREEEVRRKIESHVSKVDVVLSDASPKLSGIKSYDHARSIELAEAALQIAESFLRKGGNFVVKIFQGEEQSILLEKISSIFKNVKFYFPKATRKGSAECYIIAKGYTD